MPSMTETTQPVKVLDGKKLRTRRILAGFNMAQLAETAGCSAVHIGYLERGQRDASPFLLLQLAKATGCHPADLRPDEADGSAA